MYIYVNCRHRYDIKLHNNLTISARSEEENIDNEEVQPAKKAKLEEESDHESEGDFAEKLLEGLLLSFLIGFATIYHNLHWVVH